jgi:hypothetical protein
MSETHKILESGGFGCRICRALSGFVSVSSLQPKSELLKTGNRVARKRFEGFCRIIRDKCIIRDSDLNVIETFNQSDQKRLLSVFVYGTQSQDALFVGNPT